MAWYSSKRKLPLKMTALLDCLTALSGNTDLKLVGKAF